MSYQCALGDLLEQGFLILESKPKDKYDPGEQLKVWEEIKSDKKSYT